MKGIILAGGNGSRLYPITHGISKQLLPVYNKPMIYYSLSVLMLAGIRNILIITTPEDKNNFQRLLGDGSNFGIQLHYAIQPKPEGLAQAFLIGEQFINNDSVCLVLGDNIFYGEALSSILQQAVKQPDGARIFCYQVNDPKPFGIAEFDDDFNVLSIEEKPEQPKSHWAITGLYFYDNRVVDFAKQLTPSKRGELEITDLNRHYLAENSLSVQLLDQHFTWLDTGTYDSLLEASALIRTIEHQQNRQIACLEEIAWRNGWLTSKQITQLAQPMAQTKYGQYLLRLIESSKTP